ncbi:unnamed protein product [Brassica oleracea]|uniref:(rape) hypothetical protein n=1 Tax=Brassica napus TaxID=3708 RepID=A0A816INB4_BRANA|nr:unnamed protein product [Brassica napus]
MMAFNQRRPLLERQCLFNSLASSVIEYIHTLGEDSRTSLCSIKIVKMIFVKVPKMVNQLLYFSELKVGWCRQSVVTRNFHFWESWNVKKGGELMGFDLLLVDGKVRRIACCFFLYNIGICNRL